MVLNGHRLIRTTNGRKWPFRNNTKKNQTRQYQPLEDERKPHLLADDTRTITTEEDANSPLRRPSYSRNKTKKSRSSRQPQQVKLSAPLQQETSSGSDQSSKQENPTTPSTATASSTASATASVTASATATPAATKSAQNGQAAKAARKKKKCKRGFETVAIVFDEDRLEGQLMVESLAKSKSNIIVVLSKFDSELANDLLKMKRVSVTFVDTTEPLKVAKAIEGADRAVMISKYWEKLKPDEEIRALALVEACEMNGISSLMLSTLEDTAHLRHTGLTSQIQPQANGLIEPKFRGMKTLRRAARKSHVRVSHMLTSYLDYRHSKASLCLISGGRGRPLNVISSNLDDPFLSKTRGTTKYFRKIMKLLKKHKIIVNLMFSSMMLVAMWNMVQHNYHTKKQQGLLENGQDHPLQMSVSDMVNSGVKTMACFQVVSSKMFHDNRRTAVMVAWMAVIAIIWWRTCNNFGH
mmetsp:Transcript_23984/g.37050  ORF Transcript_23984/g.37050 Transcript_23984/m.37050 type:complete len:467 (+) Transcript_23984:95-1495(+)|eukprot:CAMPEP_0195284184 /NCGR_PEP_ID=MMETSP0707-20130614/2478_1 /TAXON_ID=33640 /ORGANISM="Asterionellopsis glacialis, Strain CCMP134" /LENGTH=466 /DNA_ID=CAMNT_0040343499 /DNA_START=18 /DNA_END=1418 /DNA_ORIENTATION=+